MEPNRTNKPANIRQAVRLLYATIGIGILRCILNVSQFSKESTIGSLAFVIAAASGIAWFLYYLIGKGRNWARITILILTLISLPLEVRSILKSIGAHPISGSLELAQMGLIIYALILLFQKPSSEWFRQIAAES